MTTRRYVDRLADAIERAIGGAVDALLAAPPELLASVGWSEQRRDAARGAAHDLARGFVRFLRIGDLEESHCQRLRSLIDPRTLGLTEAETTALIAAERRRLFERLTPAVEAEVGDVGVRILDAALGAFLALLRPAPRDSALDDPEELDAWLAAVEEAGADVR